MGLFPFKNMQKPKIRKRINVIPIENHNECSLFFKCVLSFWGWCVGGESLYSLTFVRAINHKIPQVVSLQDFIKIFAERTRFELVVGLLLRQFSKLLVSATHPPLQKVPIAIGSAKLDKII